MEYNAVMYERFSDLSSRARRCIRLAIRDERLTTPEQISELSDTEVMWRVTGNGQVHGIGKKTLAEVREVYPRSPKVDVF